mgnify:CR=1 FL=1
MKEKLRQIFIGRQGMDELSKTLFWAGIGCLLVSALLLRVAGLRSLFSTLAVMLLVLVVLFGVIFGYSAYQLYSILHEYKESERRYDSVANSAISTAAPAPVTTPYAVQPGEEQPSAPPVEQSPINVDFDNLLEQCKDIVGWIYCEDTVINYPMVRGNDNDYYLHRFIDGTYNGGGTLFMDFKCNRDFSDPNSIIYGHHMNDGSMFASLKKYQTDPEYYSKHPTLYVNTPTLP